MERSQRIGVLMGGLSVERPISLATGEAVLGALKRRGWNAVGIDVGRDLPRRLEEEGVQVAWVALHGRFGEDGCVQGLLEMMGIPYTGSGVRASAVAMDKIATKRALTGVPGVELAPDRVWRAGEPPPTDLGFPVVVKPAHSGSTIGISRADDPTELMKALDAALVHDEEILVEGYVPGEEITVTLLEGELLPVIRIAPQEGFFDYEAKYTKGRTRYRVPSGLDSAIEDHASRAGLAAYRGLGCRGVARADFIVPPQGRPVFLEINTIPGLTETSLVPMAAAAVGISFEDLVERVLHGATCLSAEVPGPG